MGRPIIEVENLSKHYRLGAIGATSLRDAFAHWWEQRRQRTMGERPGGFWALRDVSFSVEAGEVVGIIGRNGAGKSTLLKILSRITEPTSGRAVMRGRVASLLEVGTGFHPDLTGRENVFLNGAILGMTREETRRKFDEIVAFAEVDQFIDTPVKRYSSGMYVRLAFAVAAHLEPEILIVDEVLSVGDASFQNKCIGKMQDVSRKDGRTVLFVSHNMAAVAQLTERCLVLRGGELIFSGPTEPALEKYFNFEAKSSSTNFDVEHSPRECPDHGPARILRLRFEKATPQFSSNEPLSFLITIRANETLARLRTSLTIVSAEGVPIGGCFSADRATMKAGEIGDFRIVLPNPLLAPGHYYCDLGIGKGDHCTGYTDYDVVTRGFQFEVLPAPGPLGAMSQWHRNWGRIVYPKLEMDAIVR